MANKKIKTKTENTKMKKSDIMKYAGISKKLLSLPHTLVCGL